MSKDIKKALEHCAEWNCDNCPNGDELGSGETVCRGRLLPQVLEYVADLEAKLAESEKQNKRLYNEKESAEKILRMSSNEETREILQLKQQLAEKEKKIEKLKSENHALISDNAYQEADIFELNLLKEKANQDKISFAVEQLVDIQKYISDNAVYIEEETFGREINDYIDNQIKLLKEGK